MSDLVERSWSWRRLARVLPADHLVVDRRGQVAHVSSSLTTLLGYGEGVLLEREIDELVPAWRRDVDGVVDGAIDGDFDPDAIRTLRMSFLRGDGVAVTLDTSVLSLALDGTTWTVAAPSDEVLRPLTEAQLDAAKSLAESEERFRHSFEDNMAPMMFTDLENRITEVNVAFCHMVGRSRDELLGSDSIEFTYPEDVGISEQTHKRMTTDDVGRVRYTKRYLHKDGRVIVAEISKSTARDAQGNILYFVISERDITEERALSAQLAHQALHDPLTGLANRAVFDDRLSQAQARVTRRGGLNAVLLIDLDDFKGVNDVHGHQVSDHVITIIADRLEGVTRSSDTLCRFGGDEFLYLAEGLTKTEEVEELATRLLEIFTQPIPVADTQLEVHASIGVVVWDGTTSDASNIVQHADTAMYEAKRRGKGDYVIFSPTMEQHSVSRFALAQELRHALSAGELSMHYQPILDLASGEVRGFEALMRWQHPERGSVPPSVFIPLAEQSDLILELGAFALRESVAQASTWGPSGVHREGPFVTVNLSARQFHDPELLRVIDAALHSSNLSPERLVVEITESVTLVDVAETLSVIEHLGRQGIGVALDDFGTGYSSLSYLALLHPAILKIDRAFVSPSDESAQNDTLLEMIVALGQRLKMIVLAEGVETDRQHDRLRELGCDLAQGFLFSPAVPASEVETTFDRWLFVDK